MNSEGNITRAEVERVAHLARINFMPDEIQNLTQDLGKILEYITKLEQLNVDAVVPTTHVQPVHNVYREDNVLPPLTQKRALSIAISEHSGAFRVPRILEP